jgi:hypothetical protein
MAAAFLKGTLNLEEKKIHSLTKTLNIKNRLENTENTLNKKLEASCVI